jgi:type IV pilus assembly protein PilN
MRIDINLASQPYQDSRQFWSYWGTGLMVLSLISALLVFLAVTGFVRAGRDREQISKLRDKIAAYDREKSEAEAILNQPQNRALREQSRFLNALFQRKAFSWTKVFEDLERVMPAHLHVVSINPGNSVDNSLELKLLVGGDSREQALDLVRKMESSNRFRQTRIQSEKVEGGENQTTGDRVEFEIDALYTPTPDKNAANGGAY